MAMSNENKRSSTEAGLDSPHGAGESNKRPVKREDAESHGLADQERREEQQKLEKKQPQGYQQENELPTAIAERLLPNAPWVTVRVLDENGKPVPKVSIQQTHADGGHCSMDGEITFECEEVVTDESGSTGTWPQLEDERRLLVHGQFGDEDDVPDSDPFNLELAFTIDTRQHTKSTGGLTRVSFALETLLLRSYDVTVRLLGDAGFKVEGVKVLTREQSGLDKSVKTEPVRS